MQNIQPGTFLSHSYMLPICECIQGVASEANATLALAALVPLAF